MTNLRLTFVSVMLPSLMAIFGSAHAAVVGEVIAAYEAHSGRYAVMSAGSGVSFNLLSCGGDLTHGGAPRYFLQTVAGSATLPDGYLNSVLAGSDEDCTRSVILYGSSSMRFSTLPQWSHDGSRIAVYGTTWDLATAKVMESGVYLADVIRDGTGRPIAATNLRLAIASDAEPNISWSGDDQRIAYVAAAPDGSGGTRNDIWVYEFGSGTSINITNTKDLDEDQPSFSPVDDRIAFIRMVAVRGTYRFDVFTIPAAGGAVAQVTNKATTGSPQNMTPCFSPDGQYLSFVSGSGTTAPLQDFDVYRIRSNASGKAANLTGKQSGSFRRAVWRR
jgi:Tol biopolymer transport system component